MIASKSCDRTGVAAIACARHGCYCPNALVDLFRGEQQKNIDYALLRAIETTHVDPRQRIILLYDIACQYIVHLHDRIGDQLQGFTIDAGIGLFHVHAHRDQCYFRFSPSFIPGLAVVIGEILESLWSKLNAISHSAHTANLSGHAELLDDHATDSNHKKMLGLIQSLRLAYYKALSHEAKFRKYFEGLSPHCQSRLPEWTQLINNAEQVRLQNRSVMDMYSTSVPGAVDPSDADTTSPITISASSPVEKYMEYALIVEEKQFVFLMSLNSLYAHDRLILDWK